MHARKLLFALLITAGVASPAASQARTDFSVGINIGPPPPQVIVAPPPRPNYVWAPGYWAWDGYRYVWVGGQWMAPRPGYVWVAPRWERRGPQWFFVEGRWAPHHGGPRRHGPHW
jgi:hypothetical protein